MPFFHCHSCLMFTQLEKPLSQQCNLYPFSSVKTMIFSFCKCENIINEWLCVNMNMLCLACSIHLFSSFILIYYYYVLTEHLWQFKMKIRNRESMVVLLYKRQHQKENSPEIMSYSGKPFVCHSIHLKIKILPCIRWHKA